MDDEGERLAKCRTGDVQFHGNIGSRHHRSSGARPVSASRSLQTLLPRDDVPAFGAWMCMHSRLVARPHDRVRMDCSVARCGRKLKRPDDVDRFSPMRSEVSGPKFSEPSSPVLNDCQPGRALGRLSGLPCWERTQVPAAGCLIEMKASDHADVEAARCRSLLPRRHVRARHFRQVLVARRSGCLSP